MFQENRRKLYEKLEDGSMLILFSGAAPRMHNDLFYPFFPNRNFYYLTGLREQNQVLVYLKTDLLTAETLYTPVPDPALERVSGYRFDEAAVREVSGIEAFDTVDKLEPLLAKAFSYYKVRRVYLDMGMFDPAAPLTDAQKMARTIRQRAGDDVFISNVSESIARMRTGKAPAEVDCIQRAIDITGEAINAMMTTVRPGMNEYELDALFRYSVRRNGAEEGFQVIAAGKNACALHYMDNNTVIQDGSLVLTDVGAIWGMYYSDITRTFPANGRFTPRQRQLYDIVLKAQRYAISLVRPGASFNDISAKMTRALAESCMEIGLIGEAGEISNYWYGGIGHFLGLDCHDTIDTFLVKDLVLEEGMVLTVEPGLYVKEEGIGIRIEDDVLITKDGCRVLSAAIVKDAYAIQRLMQP